MYLQSFDKTKIYYDFLPGKNGKTIVFLHGMGGSSYSWTEFTKYFNSIGYSIIAPDLRGHGYSEKSRYKKFYNISNFSQDIFEIVNKHKIKKFILVGHCFGAATSMDFAAKYQKRIESLVLMSAYTKIPLIGEKKILRSLSNILLDGIALLSPIYVYKKRPHNPKYARSTDFNILRIFSDILHTSPKSYLNIFKTALNFDSYRHLSKIKSKTLVIHGEKDSVAPVNLSKDIAVHLEDSVVKAIKGGNHVLPFTKPKETMNLIESFLKGDFKI